MFKMDLFIYLYLFIFLPNYTFEQHFPTGGMKLTFIYMALISCLLSMLCG